MEPERHLELLRIEGERLAAMPPEALDAEVPTVEGWTLEKAVRHTGRVHRWVTEMLKTNDFGAAVEPLPKGPESLDAFRESLEEMLSFFKQHGPDEPCMSFAGPATYAYWFRRQHQETSVHRIDAADAVFVAGGPIPEGINPDGAADGIDEILSKFMPALLLRDGAMDPSLEAKSLHIHRTDLDPTTGSTDAEWMLRFGTDRTEISHEHAKGDAGMRGTAQDLFLVFWRRRAIDLVDVFGDISVPETLWRRLKI